MFSFTTFTLIAEFGNMTKESNLTELICIEIPYKLSLYS